MRSFHSSETTALKAYLDKGIRGATLRAKVNAAKSMVAKIQNELIPNASQPPIDLKAYLRGWRVRVKGNDVWVENDAPHAVYVEKGVSAENVKIGRKMIDALAEWAHRHGMTKDVGPRGNPEIAARSVAWAIAITLQRRGIFNKGRGLRILEKAKKLLPAILRREIVREMRRRD